MIVGILPVVMMVATATMPLPAARAAGQNPLGSADLQLGVVVNVACTLTLNPGGNFAFAAISGLGGSAPETTAENDAIAGCSAPGPARLAITDSGLTGTTTYDLVSGSHQIAFEICPSVSAVNCYTNSTAGFPIVSNSTTKMFGYLPAQGKNASGSYSDTVTVTVSFP